MTLFEYITVAISLVLALAIARTVDGVRSSLASDRRYWVHSTWVAIKLTNPMTFWWLIWRYRDLETWNLASFMLVLAWPVVLYLQVTGLVTRQPESITDWRAHFYSQRRWFFGTNIGLTLIGFAIPQLLTGNPLGVVPRLIVLTLSILGFATDNTKVHGLIVISIAITVVLGYWTPAFTPVAPT